MTNKVIADKSRCANCMSDKSKNGNNPKLILILNFPYTNHYKTC